MGFKSRKIISCVLISLTLGLLSCTSQPSEDEELSYDIPASSDAPASDSAAFTDDLEIDNEASSAAIQENNSANSPSPEAPLVADSAPDAQNNAPVEGDDFADFESTTDPAETPTLEAPAVIADLEPAAPTSSSAATTSNSGSSAKPAGPLSITNLQFKANDTGGTVLIDGDGPMGYTTRKNDRLKQFIIDIPYAKLPLKLQRTFNTRDLQGAVGSIDAYQSNENSTRVVVQLREGAPDPTVTVEGNTLLVIASNINGASLASNSDSNGSGANSNSDGDSDSYSETPVIKNNKAPQVLSSASLSDFMSGNTDFYGKKISIETTEEMEVRDAIRFIMDESGINMIISDSVKGRISLKLRQVPWDQALILIMKSKNLGYIRQGNVIRITTLEELRTEETEAATLAGKKLLNEPLKVRMFPVNYAKSAELLPQVKEFLTDKRGKATSDTRSNTVIVTDVEDNLSRIQRLIQSLDHEPPQVLIEGKIVEASEDFSRTIGVNWGFTGAPKVIGQSAGNPVNFQSGWQSTTKAANAAGLLSLTLGTLDIFGSLNTVLQLQEQESKVKILSSPRIVTMSNLEATISQDKQVTVGQKVTQVGTGPATVEPIRANIPLTLKVTPQITNDNAVMMSVAIERSFTQGSGDSLAINKRSATTNILVKNGETAVIGGIYQNDDSVTESKIPFFGNLPVVGWLFKTQDKISNKNELMIFLTPRILSRTNLAQATTISDAPNVTPEVIDTSEVTE